MANIVGTNFDYTFDGLLSTEVLYKPSVNTPEILQLFTVETGINYKKQINLVGVLDKVVRAYSGCGTRTASGTTDNIENRTLEVTELEILVEQCKDAFEQTIMGEDLDPGVARNEISQRLRTIIETVVMDAMSRDNFRIFSFGDTGGASSDYNMLDGLWKRLIDGVATYCVTQVDSITTLNQTSGTRAIDYLENLYTQAPIILKQLANNEKKFFVTGNFFENYIKTLETTSNTDMGYQLTTEGQPRVFYRGVEVVPIYAWDNYLSDADNPFNGTFNTGVIYTTPRNHFIGVNRPSDNSALSVHFEWTTRKVYFEAQYRMGYNYGHCDLQAISYGTV